jgi:hypothetical protein
MPKTSKETATNVQDFGVAIDRTEELDGYTVSFVTIKETHDLGPILKNLPTGDCQCPHWGYITKGRMVVRYDDHEEVCEAGDAFYMSPGHAPAADAGTEILMFSPTPEFEELQAAIMKAMQS